MHLHMQALVIWAPLLLLALFTSQSTPTVTQDADGDANDGDEEQQSHRTASRGNNEVILSNGDCLAPEALNLFKFTPGGYEVSDGNQITPSVCANLCTTFSYRYSGIILKTYCLCASDEDIDSNSHLVKQVDKDQCSKGAYGIEVFKSDIPSLQSMKLTATPEKVFIDESVTIDVSIGSKGDSYELLVDFDDGSPLVQWSEKRKFDHIYRIPGKFLVKVHARQSKQSEKLVAGAMVTVHVGNKVDTNEISLNCHSLIEPGDNPGCNVTLFAGQDMTVELNFGNSSDSLLVFNATGKWRAKFHSLFYVLSCVFSCTIFCLVMFYFVSALFSFSLFRCSLLLCRSLL